eukprot:268324-Rhodomonas_salina.1
MFSKSSRFVEKKNYTPGPGEYDASLLLSTTKKGINMGFGDRKVFHQNNDYAHLGPGAYGLSNETSTMSFSRPELGEALKKLACSWQKMSAQGTKVNLTGKDDVLAMTSKLIADCVAASADSIRVKGEMDAMRARLHAEVTSALKPCKANIGAGPNTAAAWKKVE